MSTLICRCLKLVSYLKLNAYDTLCTINSNKHKTSELNNNTLTTYIVCAQINALNNTGRFKRADVCDVGISPRIVT